MTAELGINQDVFWRAVEARDGAFDGRFLFGVVTTGVYCRPSCASRLPLRKNVRFYADAAAAERAGLRACKRCRPNEDPLEVRQAARMLELAEYVRGAGAEVVTLDTLAARAGMSKFHLQRSFKAVMGVTPKQFMDACRLGVLKAQLQTDGRVTDAIYEAGFGSSSRVYEKVDTHLGMTPAQYRARGAGVVISWAATDSALGRMMIGATDRGVCFVQFADSDKELLGMLAAEYPAAVIQAMEQERAGLFQGWMEELRRHLAGGSPDLHLPLDLQATAFQWKVWRFLQAIPYGEVRSYAEVAMGVGQPKAARAVAGACAVNRVALVIPCHRVIRGSGDLAGFKWGLERKRALLDVERAGRVD